MLCASSHGDHCYHGGIRTITELRLSAEDKSRGASEIPDDNYAIQKVSALLKASKAE